jgi:hypothetical protein
MYKMAPNSREEVNKKRRKEEKQNKKKAREVPYIYVVGTICEVGLTEMQRITISPQPPRRRFGT